MSIDNDEGKVKESKNKWLYIGVFLAYGVGKASRLAEY